MVSLKHNALSIVSLPRWEFIYSCKYITCRTAKTLRREVFLHGIYLLYMIHLSIQPSLTTKKGLLGCVLLRQTATWFYKSMNLHRSWFSSIQSDVTLQLAETELLRRCRKDRIEAQISKFILIYLFYTKKWLMHKSD